MKAFVPCVVVLLFSGACAQSGPSGSSAMSSSGGGLATAVQPSELTLPINFETHMNGDQEVPVRDTRGQGQAIFQVSPDGTEISYRLIASNIDNVVAAHIHQGPPGVAGPIVIFLYGNAAPGGGRQNGVLATGTLTASGLIGPLLGQPISALVALIESGNAYVNVHTNDGVAPTNTGPGDFPGGELRGQLLH